MKNGKLLPVYGLAAYALLHAVVLGAQSLSPVPDPHAFMRDPRRCGECHLEPLPEKGRPYNLLTFRKDISSLCSGCHDSPLSHPVDIAPGQSPSRNLPLDPDGTMTCITCHSPHGPSRSPKKFAGRTLWRKVLDTAFPFARSGYRTYFLRLPSVNGELCNECHARKPHQPPKNVSAPDLSLYAGSAACSACHGPEHAQWKLTPHARMLRSPRKHPDSVLAEFKVNPPFPPSEIAYVLGSRNVQRFISRRDETLVVRTPIWIIREGKWNLSYWREMNWLKMCAGCHTTGFNPYQGQYAEEGIGCEACHGPGRKHAASGKAEDIVNPSKLSPERKSMICESCHTTGHDVTGEYRFPVGFLPGGDLRRHYFGLTPKPGQDDSSFKGDDSYADRHSQFLFWQEQMLIVYGETCDLCKNFRLAREESANGGPRKMTPDEFCRSCHNGTAAPSPAHHEGVAKGGLQCLSCHPIGRSLKGEKSIHDHKFIPAGALPKYAFIPSPDFRSICFACHPANAKGA